MLTERIHYYKNKMGFFRVFLSINFLDTPVPLTTKLIGSYAKSIDVDSGTEKRDFIQLSCLYVFGCASARYDDRQSFFLPLLLLLLLFSAFSFLKYCNNLVLARPYDE